MASILDKYGIKEVADVMFYNIGDDGEPTSPVLYLDTLKVSTIEQTAEEAEARGGKGNPPLIIWDYGKEINVTLEDALFSAKSMAILFGGQYRSDMYTPDHKQIRKTFTYVAKDYNDYPKTWNSNLGTHNVPDTAVVYDEFGVKKGTIGDFKNTDLKTQKAALEKAIDNLNKADSDADGNLQKAVDSAKETLEKAATTIDKNTYFVSFYVDITEVTEIEISPNTFPGNYYITGDTYARAQKNGKDEFFQFIIPNAKIQSEQTLTLEAEGDPTVFNLNLRVLRPANGGGMMKLVKYNVEMGHDTIEADSESMKIIKDVEVG